MAAGVVGLLVVTPRVLPRGTSRMARGMPSVILSRFYLNAAFNGAITYVPLMVTQERGEPVVVAGVVLAIGSFGWSTGSWIQGQARFAGRRWMLVSAGARCSPSAPCASWSSRRGAVGVALRARHGARRAGDGGGSTTLSVLVLDLVPV